MVAAPALAKTMEMNVAQSNDDARDPLPPMRISVNAGGAISVDGTAADGMDLRAQISEAARSTDGRLRPVVIAADKEVKYELVMDVLNDLRNAGVNKVGLQTQIGKSSR